MGNKMGPEHSWGQSGRVRALVPDHILRSSMGHPCQGSGELHGLCPLGSGCPALAHSPSPAVYIILGRVFLLFAVVLSFLTTLTMLSFASQLFPRTWKQTFLSASISFFTGVEQAGSHGEGLGRAPKAGGEVKGEGSGLCDVRREDLKAPLFCWLLYEVAHPHTCPLCIYDPFLWGFSVLHTSS